MKKTVSLKKNHLFRRLYSKGRSAVSPYMAVYFRRSGQQENRLGFTVSTRLGHAVVRNRVRRRLREIYRLNEDKLVSGVDLVIVARVRAVNANYRQLEKSFLQLCGKLGILNRDGGAKEGTK